MRILTTVVAILTASMALAGCTGGDGEDPGNGAVEGKVDEGEFQLQDGRGALSGLLVDDRFRPLDLTDDPATEYQFSGFVLLQETGQQVQSNENGEFSFVDLEPGAYTLRATIDGHEASPIKVDVKEGLFAEATMIARRVSSLGSTIVTNEFSVFVPCVVTVVALTGSPDCTFDQSGDTQRFAFYPNYTAFSDLEYMVTEMKLSTPAGETGGSWGVAVRDPGAITNGIYYAEGSILEGDYIKLVNPVGGISEDGGRNTYFNNTIDFQVALFGQGLFQPELNSATCDLPDPVGRCTWGAGPQAGQEAKFIVSLFLGEPDVDIESYCVLCTE